MNDLRKAWNKTVMYIGAVHIEYSIVRYEALVKITDLLLPLSHLYQSLLEIKMWSVSSIYCQCIINVRSLFFFL